MGGDVKQFVGSFFSPLSKRLLKMKINQTHISFIKWRFLR